MQHRDVAQRQRLAESAGETAVGEPVAAEKTVTAGHGQIEHGRKAAAGKAVELPGFFRPTKEWDLLVVREKTLLVAVEAKSQVGPSFGNNFNNRTEEAMGSALDLWTAYRERAYLDSPQPFLGYLFMLEDCPSSNRPVKVKEPHFSVFPEFVGASYMRRYEVFCRKLVLERHYTAATFVSSTENDGIHGRFVVPAEDLSVERFAKTLTAHVAAFA